MRGKIVKIYLVNSHMLKSKMISLRDMTYSRDLDFVCVTEAGLQDEKSPKMKGDRTLRANHKKIL